MTHKNSSRPETIVRLRLSVVLTAILLVLGVVFAALGFSNAGDSRVAPAIIAIYLLVSAAFFAALFGLSWRQQGRFQRVIAVAALMAAVFTAAMAITFYQVLSQMQLSF